MISRLSFPFESLLSIERTKIESGQEDKKINSICKFDFVDRVKSKNIGQKKIIFIEPHVKKRRGYENKDWGFHNWQKVVEELGSLYTFLQITYEERRKTKEKE